VSAEPRFLTPEDVILLHGIAVADQGGDPAIRDRGLLEAAVAMPRQAMGGAYLHPDILSMAAAYAYHICLNHPFMDGNKRGGVAAMIAFLVDHGWEFRVSADEAEAEILRLAAGQVQKTEFIAWVKGHARHLP
jgi:death-on-curing protein